MVPICKKKH